MKKFSDLVVDFVGLIDITIPLVVGLALLLFIWGLLDFVLKTDNEQARTAGKKKMFWGIIALFVMLSVWGFVNLLGVSLGVL